MKHLVDIKYYFIIILLNFLSKSLILSIMQSNTAVLFTDSLINQTLLQQSSINITKRVQIDLINCSYTDFTVNFGIKSIIPTSSSTLSVINSIKANLNYSLNSFELKTNYFSSIQLNYLFSDDTSSSPATNRVIFTHTSFDCDEYFVNNVNSFNNSNIPIQQIICLSTSINQIVAVLKSFFNTYKYTYYSIIYSDINEINLQYLDYYKNFAKNLVYKLSLNSFKLDFTISINNPFVFDKLKNSQAKSKIFFSSKTTFCFGLRKRLTNLLLILVIILLLECGNEIDFFQKYNTIIPDTLIYLTIYNSPKCISLLNYEKNNLNFTDKILQNLFKIIPIDYSTTTTSSDANNSIQIDLNNYQNFVNENESYESMRFYNYSNVTYLNNQSTITLNCNTNQNQLCQRNFYFYLFNFNKDTNSYQDSLKFTLELPLSEQNTSTVKSALIIITNDIIWPNGVKISEVASCIQTKGSLYIKN
jgi:hypothetical protein